MKRITTRILATFCLILSVIFANLSIISPILNTQPTYAINEDTNIDDPTDTTPTDTTEGGPEDSDNTEDTEDTPSSTIIDQPTGEFNPDAPTTDDLSQSLEGDEEPSATICSDQAGSLSWIVCPVTEFVGNIIDGVYNIITDFLVVKPLTTDSTSPIYIIWQYTRSITNTIFIIFLVIVIISQITGLGINNYGVKRALPRLIIAVVLVNLSYIICSIAVDISNIIGSSLCDFLNSIQVDIMEATRGTSELADISIASVVTAILSGTTIAGLAIGIIGGTGYGFYMLLFFVIGGIVSVASGLITLAARQALVALLIMIAPLAFIAYLLPNTEKWFNQWKDLFFKMLIFYPIFSLLYGASKLVGWTIIISATDSFGVVLGLAVQVFPLLSSWSLMKMSGTILNAVNTGIRKLASPIQKSLGGWALEHAEHQRQTHFAKPAPMSSRLRGYLDSRRELRALDTKNAMEIRHDRAVTKAMIKASSITGYDEKGFTTWEALPNKHTRTAKSANFHHTAATSAIAAYQNTLSTYGDKFLDKGAQVLNNQAGDAFVESFKRQLEAKNQAEADQKWLLGKYLTATNNQLRDSYDFNYLIGDAAGGLGQDGESSIMGQVIIENSTIENRRRTEARIIATKFGVSKVAFRGMVFDKAHINDNGYETDANGTVIEDEQYNLIEYDKNGKPTNFKREQWQLYIGVHKKTGDRITKEEYDSLSDADRANYNRVRYMIIPDDNGDPVQYVYETDAGYMKELLRDDIAIGDPINLRYASEIGVAHTANEKTGAMRRYHSTISDALRDYKEHDAAMTPMVTSQINNGFVTSKAQLNLARLQSLIVATKSGNFLKNDGRIINEITKYIQSATDEKQFAFFFPDLDIDSYRTVNGIHLDGWRLATDKNGQQYWKEINHNDSDITVDDKKNLIKHKILPKAANKLVGMINKNLTQSVQDSMKPDGLKALINMRDALTDIAKKYDGEDVDFEERFAIHENKPGSDKSIFESPDPSTLKAGIRTTQLDLGINPATGVKDNTINPYRRDSIEQLEQRETRRQEAQLRYIRRNSYDTIQEATSGYFAFITNYDLLAEQLTDYIHETECLRDHAEEFETIIEKYRFDERADSADGIIHDMTHRQELEQSRIEQLRLEFEDILNTRIDYEN